MKTEKSWLSGIIVTAIVMFIMIIYLGNYFSTFNALVNSPPKSFASLSNYHAKKRKLSPENELILNGDLTQPTQELQQKALFDRFPTNKMYLANYINSLDFTRPSDELLDILNKAEKLDPNNALYNYYKCIVFMKDAVKSRKDNSIIFAKELKARDKEKADRKKGIYPPFLAEKKLIYDVVNTEKLADFMVEYYKGIAKPYFKTYIFDLHRKRAHLKFDKITNIEQQMEKITFDANMMLPHLSRSRDVVRVATFYAKKRYKVGDIAGAKKVFDSANKFLTQITDDSNSMIGILVVRANIAIFYNNGADFYNEINDEKKLQECVKKCQKMEELSALVKSDVSKNFSDRLGREGGILTLMLMPSVKQDISEEEQLAKLKPERMFWYKLVEAMYLNLMGVILVLILGVILLIALIAKFKSSKDELLIFKVTTKELGAIILCGGILPLGIFLLLTNIDALSGRTSFFQYNLLPFAMQLILLMSIMILPISWTLRHYVRKWCRKNNIEVCEKSNFFILNVITYCFMVLFFSTPLLFNFLDITSIDEIKNATALVLLMFAVYVVALLINWLLYCMNLAKKCTQYKRLYWINLLPYLAVFSVVIYFIVVMIINYQKDYYFQREDIVFNKNLDQQSTTIEHDFIGKGKQFIKENILDN